MHTITLGEISELLTDSDKDILNTGQISDDSDSDKKL